MVNSGTKPATVMSAEKKTALSTCIALIRISRRRSVHPWLGEECSVFVGSGPQKPSARRRKQALPFFRAPLEISEDILDEDHRRIHDDAEIHGADRQQVGAFTLQHQQHDGKEQRKRDVHPDDDRAAEIAQENPLDQEHQQASENEIVQNGVGGDRDQRAAIIKGNHLDSRRQAAVAVHPGDFGFDLGQHVGGLLHAAHHHDGRHHVVLLVAAANPEPRHVAHLHLRDVLHQHGNAVRLGQDDVLDVIDLVALGQIICAAVVNQADAADVDGLLADADFAPADVDVRVAQGGQHLRHRDVVGFQFAEGPPRRRIPWSVPPQLLTCTMPGMVNSRRAHDPILNGAEIGQPEMLRTDHLVTIDFPGRAVLLDLWAPGRPGRLTFCCSAIAAWL